MEKRDQFRLKQDLQRISYHFDILYLKKMNTGLGSQDETKRFRLVLLLLFVCFFKCKGVFKVGLEHGLWKRLYSKELQTATSTGFLLEDVSMHIKEKIIPPTAR